MKNIFILLPLFMSSISISQDIISSSFIGSGIVELGGNVKVQFNVDKVTICDSYTTAIEIDYFSQTIDVTVDYNYNSSCDESFGRMTEFLEEQVLLTGVYNVRINLNVPNNIFWNEVIFLGTINVLEPNKSCSNAFIPFLESICPNISREVCACNGVTYSNECFAFLEDRIGSYLDQSCSQYIMQNDSRYSCRHFSSSARSNFFESYSCSGQVFSGKEIILSYNYGPSDSSVLSFNASDSDISVFVIELVNDNLVCHLESDNNTLDFSFLPYGAYYIIVDRMKSNDYSIAFCETTNIFEVKKSALTIGPNPASNFLEIRNQELSIRSIDLYNMTKRLIRSYTLNSTSGNIELNHSSGMYLLRINYQNGEKEFSKIVIR